MAVLLTVEAHVHAPLHKYIAAKEFQMHGNTMKPAANYERTSRGQKIVTVLCFRKLAP